jgi:hypothetical protein
MPISINRGFFIPQYTILDGQLVYKKRDTNEAELNQYYDDLWESLSPERQAQELELAFAADNPPNWAAWQRQMIADREWNQVAAQGGHLVSALYALLTQVMDKPETLGTIQFVFSILSMGVSQEIKDQWVKWAKACHLPKDFVETIGK